MDARSSFPLTRGVSFPKKNKKDEKKKRSCLCFPSFFFPYILPLLPHPAPPHCRPLPLPLFPSPPFFSIPPLSTLFLLPLHIQFNTQRSSLRSWHSFIFASNVTTLGIHAILPENINATGSTHEQLQGRICGLYDRDRDLLQYRPQPPLLLQQQHRPRSLC